MAKRFRSALISSANLLPLLAGIVYLVNRYIASFDFFLPYDFAHYQLGDLCGGIIFPAYVNVLCKTVSGKTPICNFASSLALSVGCSICWDVLAPMVLEFSTPDPLDACMYVIGGILYLVASKLTAGNRK
ncbi:hypothetical protein ACTNBI_06450 [Collinsella sp. HCP28S3_G12]|uniref:hypothetical protein n=1 Tax=Collinsella sp. HCP28S3_G12 TaxID=3438926 RepID=UPI003F8C5C05